MDDHAQVKARLQTTSNPNKAFAHLSDLITSGHIRRAVIIAQYDDGEFCVVGQRANPESMAQMLLVGAETLARVAPVPPKEAETPTEAPAADTLAAHWDSLAAAIFDPDTSSTQRGEMRRAFYGGAATLFDLLMTCLDPGDDATPADLSRMDDWKAEIDRFGEDVEAGRA